MSEAQMSKRISHSASTYSSLSARAHPELAGQGRKVAVELAPGDEVMREAVGRFSPDLVMAPMLTTAIPADVWSAWPCFIIQPEPQAALAAGVLSRRRAPGATFIFLTVTALTVRVGAPVAVPAASN